MFDLAKTDLNIYFNIITFFLFCFKLGRHEVSRGILAKRSLYENNRQSGPNAEDKKNSTPKARKENVLITKKEVVLEKKDAKTGKSDSTVYKRDRTDSESHQGKPFASISKLVMLFNYFINFYRIKNKQRNKNN